MGMYGIAVRFINYTGPLKSRCTAARVAYPPVRLQRGIVLAQGIQLFTALSLS